MLRDHRAEFCVGGPVSSLWSCKRGTLFKGHFVIGFFSRGLLTFLKVLPNNIQRRGEINKFLEVQTLFRPSLSE